MDGSTVRMIDQRLLPHQFSVLECPTSAHTADAIRTMAVRGAGAIGAAAGFATAQAVLEAPVEGYREMIRRAAAAIRATRPTAHDLFYAVERVERCAVSAADVLHARQAAVATALELADENARAGEAIGRAGEPLLGPGARVLTHCNAGWLAFADWGSALAPVYRAHRCGKRPFVYVTETRPRSQGARLTAWELGEEGLPYLLVTDTACGRLFQQRAIDCVLVGADRIAANGDVANKIGTYAIALLAREHGVPFYVAAPRSTFDPATPDGRAIVIEERDEEEVLEVSGRAADGSVQRVRIAPPQARATNPAFDVTPAALVRAIITEGGLIPPQPDAIASFLRGGLSVAPS
jgi:methylthioribose-1-phosphate isomerase